MNAVGDFLGERRVNHPVALDAPLAGERRRDHMDAEMRLAPGARARMAGVQVGLIDDPEVRRGKGLNQASFDPLAHRHGVVAAFVLKAEGSLPAISFTRLLSVWRAMREGQNNEGLPLARRESMVGAMDLNSRLFDRIRVKTAPKEPERVGAPCSHPGCKAEGVFRAPKGRDHEGEYFTFCKEHIREYNATYDYFKGMNDEALAKFRQDDVVGHRPTWKMGPRGGAPGHAPHRDESVFAEARTARRRGTGRSATYKHQPRYNAPAMKALLVLELDATADEPAIKARYKEMVKRHHPDANGGDRGSEEKLREIIQAYNFLKSNKLV